MKNNNTCVNIINKLKMSLEDSKLWCKRGHLNLDQSKFIQKLSKEQKPRYCLETGFCTGRSSLSVIYGNEDNIEKFIMVDINFDYWTDTREYIEKFESEYSFYNAINGSSTDILNEEFFVKEFPNGIDWFTVDGGHTYDACYSDMSRGWSRINSGGVMIVDDYMSGPPNGCPIPAVTKAVDDFAKKEGLSAERWNCKGKGFAVFYKEDVK